jgi:hypothetical protein
MAELFFDGNNTRVSTFNEGMYRAFYNDLDALIPETFATGLEHFRQVGQFLGSAKKEAFYTGDSGNNIITGSGADIDIIGVAISSRFTEDSGPNGPALFTPLSYGVGERDTMVGRPDSFVEDGFFLSAVDGLYSRTNGTSAMIFGESSRLYVGQGNRDYARIINFTPEFDYVSLSGSLSGQVTGTTQTAVNETGLPNIPFGGYGVKEYEYVYSKDKKAPGGYSLKIYTQAENDLVGIVEGIHDLQPRNFLADVTFRLSGRIPARGFNDAVYELYNDVSGGLEHYVKTGQFDNDLFGVFSGAPIGSAQSNGSPITSGNDTLIAYGRRSLMSGVALSVNANGTSVDVDPITGIGERDVLVGNDRGQNDFLLGFGSETTDLTPFYVGNGDADYALIQNYEKRDRVLLAGSFDDYTIGTRADSFGVGGGLTISKDGDLIGIVEDAIGVNRITSIQGGLMTAVTFTV